MTPEARRAAVGLWVALAILGSAGVVAYEATIIVAGTVAWLEHTHEVIDRLLGEREALADAEALRRAYGLTGDDAWLDVYAEAIQRVAANRKGARELTVDNASQQERLDQLEQLIQKRMLMSDEAIDTKKRRMDTDELENEQMKAGRTIDVRIDAVISDMMNEERRLLALRRHRTAETVTYMQLVQVTGTIMSFAILLVTFLRLRRETVRRFLRAAIASSVEWLESQGVPDRPFLVGDRLTIADLTAAALLAPLACPDEHPIYGAARYRAGIAPLVGAWQDGRAFQWIRQTYRLHRGTWPRGSEIRRAIDAV